MSSKTVIRSATAGDAAAIAQIYAPFVTDTAISFEETPPDTSEMAGRIEKTLRDYPYLVAEQDGQVVAYAYASQYRPRHAYRFTAEVTVYSVPEGRGEGLATRLYQQILNTLSETGFHTAIAIITLPNEKSVAFHERLGFRYLGTVEQVGHKFGRWHSTGIWQQHLEKEHTHG